MQTDKFLKALDAYARSTNAQFATYEMTMVGGNKLKITYYPSGVEYPKGVKKLIKKTNSNTTQQ